MSHRFTLLDAKQIGAQLCVDWHHVDLHEFLRGLNVEREHGGDDPATDVTHDDPILTGKIALAHLRERPDYYTLLEQVEEETTAAAKTGDRRGDTPAVEPVDAIC